ncbi:hypothetical protein HNY73_011262 [Argiope bruennichi]|uniref:Uncharacterized protein n=1 Tax=Argiope bruennichi TaxID=94029 RepID=A0A8T0F3J5_ARGBR|nr:hypothetical protein HNY73_011262 [Argiope bruennichi]
MNNVSISDEGIYRVNDDPGSKGVPFIKEAEVLETDDGMSTSSALEDILVYNINEELEETSDVNIPALPPPKARKQKLKYIIPTKYKNV